MSWEVVIPTVNLIGMRFKTSTDKVYEIVTVGARFHDDNMEYVPIIRDVEDPLQPQIEAPELFDQIKKSEGTISSASAFISWVENNELADSSK